MEKGDDTSIYGVIRSPLRRAILLHLYSNVEATAAELKSITGVSYGTLYYHIDALKPFLKVIGRGRFRLSDEGLRIARRLLEDESTIARPDKGSLWDGLALGFAFARGGATTVVIIGFISLFHAMLMSKVLDLSPSIMHLRSGFSITWWSVSVLIITAYMLAAYYILKRGYGSAKHVMAAVMLSYTSVAIYLSIIALSTRVSDALLEPLVIQAGFIVAHIWQLAILASGLNHATGAGYDKSIPAVLVLSYISLALAQRPLLPI